MKRGRSRSTTFLPSLPRQRGGQSASLLLSTYDTGGVLQQHPRQSDRRRFLRVCTWNLKQAVAPRKPLPELWTWLEDRVSPTVAVLTEARVPKGGPPSGWSVQNTPEGIGKGRPWGTVLAARGATLEPVTHTRSRLKRAPLQFTFPATVQVADVLVGRERWATVVGVYGLGVNRHGERTGSGRWTIPLMARELAPLLESNRGERLILAGDFNLWPCDAQIAMTGTGLVDLVEHTAHERPALGGCSGCTLGEACGHMWTHRNGNSPRAAVQNIDFMYASRALLPELMVVTGGIADFPDAWQVSDHAPVVADFR